MQKNVTGKCDNAGKRASDARPAPRKPKAKARRNPAKGIYLRGDTYWLNFQRNGTRHFITLETADFAEAMARAQRLRDGPELAAKTGLPAEIEAFLTHKKSRNIFSRATARISSSALNEFAGHHPGRSARDIRRAHIEAHYRRLQARVRETSAQIHLRAIRSFFSWTLGEHGQNPVKGITLAKIDQRARKKFCTKAQRDLIITDAPTDDLRFIFYCGFHAGLRKGEIIEARVEWFDLHEGGAVHVQNSEVFRIKDREARFIPITAPFRAFLRTYLAGCQPHQYALRPEVQQGRGTYRYDFHRPFNDYLVAKGLRWVTAHVMRHTFASILAQRGVSIFKVAAWLGDRVDVTEDHYAHLAPQDADIERSV